MSVHNNTKQYIIYQILVSGIDSIIVILDINHLHKS